MYMKGHELAIHQFSMYGMPGRRGSSCNEVAGTRGRGAAQPAHHRGEPWSSPGRGVLWGGGEVNLHTTWYLQSLTCVAEEGEVYVVEQSCRPHRVSYQTAEDVGLCQDWKREGQEGDGRGGRGRKGCQKTNSLGHATSWEPYTKRRRGNRALRWTSKQ